MKIPSSNIQIRFNTEKEKYDSTLPAWRVLVDGNEELADKVEINVPGYTSEDILPSGQKKWHISCRGLVTWSDKTCRINPPSIAGVIWFTGLPCSGKTTLAAEIKKIASENNLACEHLDGDEIRKLVQDLSFSKEDRENHIKRVGHLASLLEKQKVLVVVSLISPTQSSRDFSRKLCQNFFEVHVNTPISVCERRDIKGFFRKARSGELKQFTGVNDPYEEPLNPEMKIASDLKTPSEISIEIWKSYLEASRVFEEKQKG